MFPRDEVSGSPGGRLFGNKLDACYRPAQIIKVQFYATILLGKRLQSLPSPRMWYVCTFRTAAKTFYHPTDKKCVKCVSCLMSTQRELCIINIV